MTDTGSDDDDDASFRAGSSCQVIGVAVAIISWWWFGISKHNINIIPTRFVLGARSLPSSSVVRFFCLKSISVKVQGNFQKVGGASLTIPRLLLAHDGKSLVLSLPTGSYVRRRL